MGGFSIFPLELWFMIFQYLREESPQHISRLAQTCKSFYQELNHVIYQPVRLRRVENARRFANTVSGRPDLAALVKEVRHAEDMGFADFAGYSEPFYKALAKLPNLETLVMRKTLYPSAEYSPQAELQEVLTEISNVSEYRDVPESYLKDLMMDMADRGYPLGDASDPFGLGFHPCQEDFSLQGWAQDLAEHAYFSRDYLKDLIPAVRTCKLSNRRTYLKYLFSQKQKQNQATSEPIRISTRTCINLLSILMRQFSHCPICKSSASLVLHFGDLDWKKHQLTIVPRV